LHLFPQSAANLDRLNALTAGIVAAMVGRTTQSMADDDPSKFVPVRRTSRQQQLLLDDVAGARWYQASG